MTFLLAVSGLCSKHHDNVKSGRITPLYVIYFLFMWLTSDSLAFLPDIAMACLLYIYIAGYTNFQITEFVNDGVFLKYIVSNM